MTRARLLAIAVAVVAMLSSATPGSASASGYHRGPFGGLGTWVDIFSAQWNDPEAAVAVMAQHGVKTLYLETGNYSHHVDVYRPEEAGRFIDAAHAAGIRVVAWYLPSFLYLKADARRSLAAIRFRSATGQKFDGFALDIEATSVHSLKLRDRRLIKLSARIRYSVHRRYPLGAITPSPVGMSQYFWPNIPYRALTRYYKVFLPMAYSTLRGIHSRGGTLDYLNSTVSEVRTASGNPKFPIHLIGGLSGSMGKKATIGFLQAVAQSKPFGWSLYAFDQTTDAAWRALSKFS